MVTLSELRPGQHLSEPIELTVTEIEKNPAPNRDAVVYVTDSVGEESYLIDWSKTALGATWTVGSRYTVSDIGVKSGGKDYRLYLDPTNSTEVIALGPAVRRTQLLVMGDSHIGRTSHPKDGRAIDCTGQFRKALDVATSRDVDAVVHTGDVFHDAVSRRDLSETEAGLDGLVRQSIPFCYILGNHEASAGERLLKRYEKTGAAYHLSLEGVELESGVILHGVDHHSPAKFPKREVSRVPSSGDIPRILVLHQTLSSVRRFGKLDLPKSILARFDYVLAGDLHDAERHEWTGGGVLYPGSTEWLSRKAKHSTPSVWVLTIDAGDRSLERIRIA